MHPNPIFRKTAEAANVAYARSRGFGTLAVNGLEGPMLSHIPFLLSEDGESLELHLVKSNPIARALGDGPLRAKIAVAGPDGYVSPDWYGVPDQVPTWNYVAVHLSGEIEARPAVELHAILYRLSAHFEERLAPKTPWTTDKMSDGMMEKMMRAIAPFRMRVEAIDSTWKLNQNKDDAVRLSAADHMAETGYGSEAALLAALMRDA